MPDRVQVRLAGDDPVDDVGVEPCAGVAAELLDRPVERARVGQLVERVHGGEDARADRDVGPGEAVGVPVPSQRS